MKEFLKENINVFIIIGLWFGIGMISQKSGLITVPLLILLMRRREMYYEMFIGFLFILIMTQKYTFASDTKDIYLVALLLFAISDKKNFTIQPGILTPFIPFFAVAFFCLIYSETFQIGLEKTLSYLILLLVIPTYMVKLYKDRGEIFLKELIYHMVLSLTIGIFIGKLSPNVVEIASGRLAGIFMNPNGLGIFSLFVFLVTAIIREYIPDAFTRAEMILMNAIIILAMYWSGSRTSVVALVMFLICKYFFRISSSLGFVVSIALLFGYEFFQANSVSIVTGLGLQNFFRLDTLGDFSGRTIAWSFAWQEIQNNFYFGMGFNYTEYLFAKYMHELAILGHLGNAHNSFLTFWLDTGLVGLVCFIVALVVLFFKAAKNSIGAFPIFFAVLLTGFYESWLTSSLNPFTFHIIIILSILTCIEKNSNDETEPGLPGDNDESEANHLALLK